jgi:hypothetical protein
MKNEKDKLAGALLGTITGQWNEDLEMTFTHLERLGLVSSDDPDLLAAGRMN